MTTALDQLQLITVDPAELTVRDQIRADATPDDQLVESVRQHGVQQPPTVTLDPETGRYAIVIGHRRVGAAIAAGLSEIYVIVRDQADADAAATLERQIVENERRKGLSPAEVARGWADLEGIFGLTPEEIAAALAEPPERVRAGIRGVRSEATRALMVKLPAIDLEKAAVLTEFDEHPAVQAALADTAATRPEDFEWRAQNARNKIAKDARTAELKAEIKAAKVKLAKTDTYGTLKSGAQPLSVLVDEAGKKLTPKRHQACPGHAAYVAGHYLEDLKIVYVCIDYKAQGHALAGSPRRELTDEEKQAQAEEQARAEAVEANRTTRRRWIHDLLPGKINQLPGVYEYMAAALLRRVGGPDHRVPELTLPLLGIEPQEGWHERSVQFSELVEAKRIAPFRLLLATSLAVHESHLANGYGSAFVVRHLEQLQRWGYSLTELDTEALTAHRDRIAAAAADSATGDAS